MPKSSIAWAMIAVALVAAGLAAFRAATPLLATIVFWSTYAVLVVATLAAAVRGRRASHWVGFAISGWASFLVNVQLIRARSEVVAPSPVGPAIAELAWRTFPRPSFPPTIDFVRADRISPMIRYSPPDGALPPDNWPSRPTRKGSMQRSRSARRSSACLPPPLAQASLV